MATIDLEPIDVNSKEKCAYCDKMAQTFVSVAEGCVDNLNKGEGRFTCTKHASALILKSLC